MKLVNLLKQFIIIDHAKLAYFFHGGGIGMGLGSLGSIGESSITCTNLSAPIELTVKELEVSVYYIILENISLFYTT